MLSESEKKGHNEFLVIQKRKARKYLLTDILGELTVMKIGYSPSARNIRNLTREYRSSPCYYLLNHHPEKFEEGLKP